MAEDKPGKPRSAAELKAAWGVAEMVKINKQMHEAVAAQTEQIKAARAAHHVATQAELEKIREQGVHRPKMLDDIRDGKAFKEALGKMDRTGMYEATIFQWDDGYGNIIYLKAGIGPDQVPTISSRITEQQKSFSTLGADEQAKARTGFGSVKGTTNPYHDFFQSEALGERFKELKQSSPTPK